MKILKVFLILTNLCLFLHASNDQKEEHKFRNLEYLNLNKTQIKELKKVLIEFKQNYNEFYVIKERDEDQLKEILKSDNFDREKYAQTYRRINFDIAVIEATKMDKIHKILTPIQRKKFAEHLEEWELD